MTKNQSKVLKGEVWWQSAQRFIQIPEARMRSKTCRIQKTLDRERVSFYSCLVLYLYTRFQLPVVCVMKNLHNVSFLVMSNNAPFLVMKNSFIKISTATSFSNALQYFSEGKTLMLNKETIIRIIFRKLSYLITWKLRLFVGSIHPCLNVLVLCLLTSRDRDGPAVHFVCLTINFFKTYK